MQYYFPLGGDLWRLSGLDLGVDHDVFAVIDRSMFCVFFFFLKANPVKRVCNGWTSALGGGDKASRSDGVAVKH